MNTQKFLYYKNVTLYSQKKKYVIKNFLFWPLDSNEMQSM